jgi:lantibiotic transport system permease protein
MKADVSSVRSPKNMPMSGGLYAMRSSFGDPVKRKSVRKRPSLIAAMRWEMRKSGILWYVIATVLFDAIGVFNGLSQYFDYRSDFEEQGLSWLAVWGQAALIPSMMFTPLLLAAFASQVEANEHKGRNWLRLNATGTVSMAIGGKLLNGLLISMFTTAVFELEFVLAGRVIAGFSSGSGLVSCLERSIPMTLAAWAIVTLTQAVGVACRSFAGAMSTVFLMVLVGCALALVVPPLAVIYPFSGLTVASSVLDMADIGSIRSMTISSVTALIWVLVGASLLRFASKRAA